MKKLFLIDGAMRPAKTEIVEYLKDLSIITCGKTESKNNLVLKQSTKTYEDGEENDKNQDFISNPNLENEIKENSLEWIKYSYSGNIYAVKKVDLEKSLEEHENTFLILRSSELITELKAYYSLLGIKVIVIYIYSDKKTIADIYSGKKSTKGVNAEMRNRRLSAADADYENSFAKSAQVYDEVIIFSSQNMTGSSSIKSKLFSVIQKYDFVREVNSIFIIHSFRNEAIAKELIGSVEASSNRMNPRAKCDSLLFGSGGYIISSTVFEAIENSDYIVCDITPDRCTNCKKNTEGSQQKVSPNIWIELGYALATIRQRNILPNKNLILCCKEEKSFSLPTDIQGYNVMVYKTFKELTSKLSEHFNKI